MSDWASTGPTIAKPTITAVGARAGSSAELGPRAAADSIFGPAWRDEPTCALARPGSEFAASATEVTDFAIVGPD